MTDTGEQPARIDLAPDEVGAGLAQIVLVVMRLLHELLERQAIRRVDGGQLSDQQVEALGSTLQQAREHLDHLQSVLVPQQHAPNSSTAQNEDTAPPKEGK